MSEAHVHVDPSNKKVALFIAVLALVLAFAETLGKGSQTSALASHIEASNLWAFFQAKTIRQTVLRTAAEQTEIDPLAADDTVAVVEGNEVVFYPAQPDLFEEEK